MYSFSDISQLSHLRDQPQASLEKTASTGKYITLLIVCRK